MTQDKQQIIDGIESQAAEFCRLSDAIWDFAEVRFALSQSADLLCSFLAKEGFTIERGLAGMNDAFVATWAAPQASQSNGAKVPVIGILGEYDALAAMSQVSGLSEKKPLSEGENGHGCGHQALGAACVAAVVSFKRYLEKSGRTAVIKYFGCPAEESGSGKAYMARAGVFKSADVLFTWHPMAETAAWGASTLANYQIRFRFKGKSAHAAAAPHMGRSALDACELMNVGVNYLREHIVQEARVHYAYIDAGGGSPNVVQATAGLLYFIRAPKSSQVRQIYERVADIARGAALMTGTTMEIEWDSACAEYIPNGTLAGLAHANLIQLGPVPFTDAEFTEAAQYRAGIDKAALDAVRANVARAFKGESGDRIDAIAAKPLLHDIFPFAMTDGVIPGSTDVGDASWQTPTGQFTVGMFPAGIPPHSWQWVALGKNSIVHKGLLHAAKAMAMSALDILDNPSLIEKAHAEWLDRLGGETYRCAIPEEVVPK